MVHLICFRLEIPFLGKFGPKNQNCQFRLKFGTEFMQNSIRMFTVLGFGPKYLFWAYLMQKFKFVCSGKFATQIKSNIQNSMGVFFILLKLETPFLGKFGPKNENCQFQLKFDTQSNSNMKNSMVMFTPFYGKFVSKNQDCVLKLKFGTQTNLIM